MQYIMFVKMVRMEGCLVHIIVGRPRFSYHVALVESFAGSVPLQSPDCFRVYEDCTCNTTDWALNITHI